MATEVDNRHSGTGKIHSGNSKEGDHDSGVDESTQGNDHSSSNGDNVSPRKTVRNTSRLTTPTKDRYDRSFSRGSTQSPSIKSPDSGPGTPGSTERKKIPMNKIQVGSAPSPNLKVVKSKIGSLANASYKPGGGNVKIEHKKIDVSSARSKIGAKNDTYQPGGGEKKIISQKLQWNAKSKIGSLENAHHKPQGGDKKIESIKLDFKEKAKPKIGSKDNMKHVPGGGDVKIENKKLEIKAESKIGSLNNVKHKPGGGDKKIFDDKEYLRQMSGSSGGAGNKSNSYAGSQSSIPSVHSDSREPISDENLNREN